MSLKNKLLNILYSLPFGLKGADSEIFGSKTNSENGTEISQEVSDERLGRHLLKGEVTQSVEELRYKTYKVANESKNYNFIGNGNAIKEEKPKKILGKIKFTQDNCNLCESVLQTLQQVDKKGGGGPELYRFEFGYEDIPRFRIEKYATSVDVYIDDKKGDIFTTLHFNVNPNPYDVTSKQFTNELLKLNGIKNDSYALSKNAIASSFISLSFSTYKATNEDDFTNYCFIGEKTLISVETDTHEVRLKYKWESYLSLPLNLEEKYYSKTMDEKYKNKEKKENVIPITNVERKRYCSVCGKEMSVYDGDIQEADNQAVICSDCLKKALK